MVFHQTENDVNEASSEEDLIFIDASEKPKPKKSSFYIPLQSKQDVMKSLTVSSSPSDSEEDVQMVPPSKTAGNTPYP